MQNLSNGLKQVTEDLEQFFSVENKNGFMKDFASWVYKQWSENHYYETEVVDAGYDVSEIPKLTEFMLKDKCQTYSEFINSNTDKSEITFISGNGMACVQYSKSLQEFFGETSINKLNELISTYKLEVPEKYKGQADQISDLIFRELVSYTDDSELCAICDNISFRFSECGTALEQYLCFMIGWDADGKCLYSDKSIFSKYTLDDFQKLIA